MSNYLRGLFVVLGLVLTIPAFAELAIEPGTDTQALASRWKEAGAFFNAGEVGSFKADGVKLVYRIFFNASNKRSIVIFPGFGEAPQKYVETIFDFGRRGYNVFYLSHRGMGESQRLLSNPQIVHIDDAKKYYSDAEYFLDKMVGPRLLGQPAYLFSHSMGGLIAANVLVSRPDFFKRAVFGAPMFEMNLHGYSRTGAYIVGSLVSSTKYAPGSKDIDPTQITFDQQTSTHSKARWWYLNQMFRKNKPLWVGGPSTAWVLASLNATAEGKVATLARQIRVPVLLLQAGDDTYVMPEAQNEFVKNVPDAWLVHFPSSRHEIHQERDFIRNRALKVLFDFLEE